MTSTTAARPSAFLGLLLTTTWVLGFFAARFVLGLPGLSPGLRVAVAIVPVVPFAGFLGYVVRSLSRLDELERRVHLEALAVAFPLTLLLLMTLGLLQIAIALPADDLSYRHVWPIPAFFYFVGLALARRRYR